MLSRNLGTAAAQRFLPQTAGYAITSDLASVVCSPSRMASSFISNVSKAQPRNGNNKELWDE
jgi:hypothetical protein